MKYTSSFVRDLHQSYLYRKIARFIVLIGFIAIVVFSVQLLSVEASTRTTIYKTDRFVPVHYSYHLTK